MNNNNAVDKLISLNVELEGILRVLSHRDNSTARKLAAEKFEAFEKIFRSFLSSDTEEMGDNFSPKMNETSEAIDSAIIETKETLAKAYAVEVKDQEAVDAEVEPEMDAAEAAIAREECEKKIPLQNINVEQMLARKAGEDLRKLFTINDRFRYARELFNGSMESLLITLEKLNNFSSLSEAQSYLSQTLKLDLENEEVKEFLEVIAPHYNA